jgi:[CysO sulfur-carrier protein]-S-L-cysteine hydrolase
VSSTIQIRRAILFGVVKHARQSPGQECCGLLAGREGVITRIFPATNALASPTAYEIAPQDLLRLMREIRGARTQLMGIYHSHPTGRNEPSPLDIERAYYPEAAYFILSPQSDAARPVRAFCIRQGTVAELTIHVV